MLSFFPRGVLDESVSEDLPSYSFVEIRLGRCSEWDRAWPKLHISLLVMNRLSPGHLLFEHPLVYFQNVPLLSELR